LKLSIAIFKVGIWIKPCAYRVLTITMIDMVFYIPREQGFKKWSLTIILFECQSFLESLLLQHKCNCGFIGCICLQHQGMWRQSKTLLMNVLLSLCVNPSPILPIIFWHVERFLKLKFYLFTEKMETRMRRLEFRIKLVVS